MTPQGAQPPRPSGGTLPGGNTFWRIILITLGLALFSGISNCNATAADHRQGQEMAAAATSDSAITYCLGTMLDKDQAGFRVTSKSAVPTAALSFRVTIDYQYTFKGASVSSTHSCDVRYTTTGWR